MLQAESPWDVDLKGNVITARWNTTLSRSDQIQFNKQFLKAVQQVDSFSLSLDISNVPTHNMTVQDSVNMFLDRLKVTNIVDLKVIVTGSTARHRITKLISMSLLNCKFEVIENPATSTV